MLEENGEEAVGVVRMAMILLGLLCLLRKGRQVLQASSGCDGGGKSPGGSTTF